MICCVGLKHTSISFLDLYLNVAKHQANNKKKSANLRKRIFKKLLFTSVVTYFNTVFLYFWARVIECELNANKSLLMKSSCSIINQSIDWLSKIYGVIFFYAVDIVLMFFFNSTTKRSLNLPFPSPISSPSQGIKRNSSHYHLLGP